MLSPVYVIHHSVISITSKQNIVYNHITTRKVDYLRFHFVLSIVAVRFSCGLQVERSDVTGYSFSDVITGLFFCSSCPTSHIVVGFSLLEPGSFRSLRCRWSIHTLCPHFCISCRTHSLYIFSIEHRNTGCSSFLRLVLRNLLALAGHLVVPFPPRPCWLSSFSSFLWLRHGWRQRCSSSRCRTGAKIACAQADHHRYI